MNLDPAGILITLATQFGIAAIIAASLNLEYGVAGIPNFGKALFVSLGAYAAGWTTTRWLPLLAGREPIAPCGDSLVAALQLRSEIQHTEAAPVLLAFGAALVLAAAVAALAGCAAAYPVLRLRQEWYAALVLLAAAEIARTVSRVYEPIACGHHGIAGISHPFAWAGSPRLGAALFAGAVVAAAGAAHLLSARLIASPFGRLLRAVRENPDVAQGLGKRVPAARLQTLAIGSALTGVAGVLFAMHQGFVSSSDYGVSLTLEIWIMVALGGPGSPRGALLGALVVTLLNRLTAVAGLQLQAVGLGLEYQHLRPALFALLLLLILRYRPQGLVPERTAATPALEWIR